MFVAKMPSSTAGCSAPGGERCESLTWVDEIGQARDLLFTTRRNRVKCVKYISMKLPYMAQQVGNAYFYRLAEIKELSGSLW